MNSEISNQNNDEIELIDIWRFFQRQFIFMAFTACSLTAFALAYGIMRPTLWQSSASLSIGEKYLLQQQTQIESFEEIKYKYSKNTAISQVKNTRIIEISTTAESEEKSLADINVTISEIVRSHKQLSDDKRAELVGILHSLGLEKSPLIDAIRVLDNASSATTTRQLGEITTVEKPYGGLLQKTVALGTLLGGLVAVLLALARDFVARKSLTL